MVLLLFFFWSYDRWAVATLLVIGGTKEEIYGVDGTCLMGENEDFSFSLGKLCFLIMIVRGQLEKKTIEKSLCVCCEGGRC